MVHVSDDLSVRYALVKPQGEPTADATIVDFGGPGSSLFGQDWPGDSLQLIANTLKSNVVALEEPWVTVDYPDGCRAAAAQWYRALHEGSEADDEAFAESCNLAAGGWGWTPASYRAAVKKALDVEDLTLRAFVGASFAAIRLSYLSAPPPIVMLASPYAVGGTADDYLRSRAASTQAYCAVRAPSTCRTYKATPTGSRSLAVTRFDLGAAWIASNYQVKPAEARLALRHGGNNPELIGALSDAVTGRFGQTDVSPSTFAYFAELCPRFSHWTSAPSPGGPAGDFLRQWHVVCSQFEYEPVEIPPRNSFSHLCLVVSRHDGVVPIAVSQAAWGQRAAKYLVFSGTAHGRIDQRTLGACRLGHR